MIFLDFLGSSKQIEGGQNMVSKVTLVRLSLSRCENVWYGGVLNLKCVTGI